MLDQAREELAAAARHLAAQGLVTGTSGNVSARAGEAVAVTPTGCVLAELEPADVSIVALDGELLEGRFAPTSELGLHLGVYQRYAAGAVVHTHAPMATALSCVLDEVPCVHYTMLQLGGTVRVAPYETFGTPELAEAVLTALESRAAALMANHGAVVHGPDLSTAVASTELLEWACTVYWRAAAIGEPRTLSEDDRQAVVMAVIERGYGELRPGEEP
jgi:L-fuculose-phosphate aldolase